METFPPFHGPQEYEVAFAPEARKRLRRLPATIEGALVRHLRLVGEVAAVLPPWFSSGGEGEPGPPLVVTVYGVSARYQLHPERRAVKVLEVVSGA